MRYRLVIVILATLQPVGAAQQSSGRAALFEGALLIAGDGSAPIADAALLVEQGTIRRVGRRGEIAAHPRSFQGSRG